MEDTWEKDLDLRLSKGSLVFQNPHVIYATTRVNSFTIFLLSLFYCRQNLCQVNRKFFRRTSWWSHYVPFFVWCIKISLKEIIHKAFSHRNYGSKFVVLGYNSTYFSNKMQKGKTCYSLASWIFLSFTSFWRNSDSYEYKNKSARRGAQFVPIGMPTTCWNSIPP
jgi:hypothetical protein